MKGGGHVARTGSTKRDETGLGHSVKWGEVGVATS